MIQEDEITLEIKDFIKDPLFKKKVERIYKASLSKNEEGNFELFHTMMYVAYLQIKDKTKYSFAGLICDHVEQIHSFKSEGKDQDRINKALDTLLLLEKIGSFKKDDF